MAGEDYLNIWVCPPSDPPGGDPRLRAVPRRPAGHRWRRHPPHRFGTRGTAQAPFNLGRTATHEIGHWLDLRHIWGDDDGCGGSDLVDDTPNQARRNFGSPPFPHVSCNNGPNGDMFMNYMDYTDDVAMFMFTNGQSRRMDACLEGARASFLSPPAFALTGGQPGSGAADAGPTKPKVGTAEMAAPERSQAQAGDDAELLQLRREVEQLRQDNHRAMLILDGMRTAFNTASATSTGG